MILLLMPSLIEALQSFLKFFLKRRTDQVVFPQEVIGGTAERGQSFSAKMELKLRLPLLDEYLHAQLGNIIYPKIYSATAVVF